MSLVSSQKTLVLVHGFLGSSSNWLSVVSRLKKLDVFQGWDFYCPNLRWHSGDSDRFLPLEESMLPPKTWDVSTHLLDQINENVSGQVLFLGHSFGLRPLLQILAHNELRQKLGGKKVLGLIAEDSCPELSDRGLSDLDNILLKTPVPFASREEARQYFDTEFGKASALSKFLLSNIREEVSGGGHVWRFSETILHDLLNHSRNEPLFQEWLSVPDKVWMVVGELSLHMPPDRCDYWKSQRLDKNAPVDLQVIAGAGHWIHADQLDRFCVYLASVVSRLND